VYGTVDEPVDGSAHGTERRDGHGSSVGIATLRYEGVTKS
jgi:hypothetical protein